MLITPGIAPPTLAHTSRRARPIVALARHPGPNTPTPELISSAARTGPLIASSGATASVVPDTPSSAKAGSQMASTAAITTGRYSGRQPAITALMAIFSTGSFSSISYRGFLLREAPVAVIGLLCVFVVVRLVYRRDLPERFAVTGERDRQLVHYPLMVKTLLAVGVMLLAFLAGVPIAVVAIGGAAYSLLTRRVKPEKVYREVNWSLLVLFVGLFVLTGALEASGLAEELARWAARIGLHRPIVLTVVAALVSNLVSNVPAVLLFKPLIPAPG